MGPDETPDLWSRIDYSLVGVPDAPAAQTDKSDQAEYWRKYWKWRRPVLDLLGSVLWLYGLLKVFVVDLDTAVLGDVSQYRGFFFLGMAAVLVLVLRKTWPIVGGFAYVLGFPLVLLCWKLPKLIYKTRSPVAFLAAVNAVTSVLGDIRHVVLAATLAAFSALAIAVSHNDVVLTIAGLAMLALLVQALFRTIKFSVVPTRFVRMQQRGIRRAVDSQLTRTMISPGADLRRADIEKFNETQQAAFVQNLAHGVIAHRLLNFWAYQLERYRRSPASAFFNGLAYVWLTVRVILALAFLNLALYHGDPSAFSFATPPTFLVFTRYVIAGLYGGEINALHPESDLANAVSILAFLVGLLVLGSLVLSSALTFRAARDESEIRETIADIKREGSRLDATLREEYDVSVPEAIERLRELKSGLMGVITFFSTRIPKDFEEGNGYPQP